MRGCIIAVIHSSSVSRSQLPWHQAQQLDVIAVFSALLCLLVLGFRSLVLLLLALYHRLWRLIAGRCCADCCGSSSSSSSSSGSGSPRSSGSSHRARWLCALRSARVRARLLHALSALVYRLPLLGPLLVSAPAARRVSSIAALSSSSSSSSHNSSSHGHSAASHSRGNSRDHDHDNGDGDDGGIELISSANHHSASDGMRKRALNNHSHSGHHGHSHAHGGEHADHDEHHQHADDEHAEQEQEQEHEQEQDEHGGGDDEASLEEEDELNVQPFHADLDDGSSVSASGAESSSSAAAAANDGESSSSGSGGVTQVRAVRLTNGVERSSRSPGDGDHQVGAAADDDEARSSDTGEAKN